MDTIFSGILYFCAVSAEYIKLYLAESILLDHIPLYIK